MNANSEKTDLEKNIDKKIDEINGELYDLGTTLNYLRIDIVKLLKHCGFDQGEIDKYM